MDHPEAPASFMLPPQRDETVRYSKEEWERHRLVIEGMYPLKGMHLKDIIDFLNEDRGFVVNERQLKRKIKDWKLEKNVKGDEMRVIARKMHQRVGKNTTFRVRGQTVDPAKIERWQKRSGTLNTTVESTPPSGSPAPSTPSDISYNTVQEVRSPSPYLRNSDSLVGLVSELEGRPLPSSISSPQNNGHIHSSQGAFSTHIASILVEDGSLFEGQSPAPFTAPPSPAPSQEHEIHGALSNSSPSVVMDSDFANSENEIRAPFTPSTVPIPEPQPVQTPQKKRYKQKEELELTQRLNDLQSKYGSDHPATIDTVSRLARILMAQSRYRYAEHLLKQYAESSRKIFGEDDPRTIRVFSELPVVFMQQGQYSKARFFSEILYLKASKVLHPSHPTVLYIKTTLADCHGIMGNEIEAERLSREVLVLGRESLPPDDPIILSAMKICAELLLSQGKHFEAVKMLAVLDETWTLSRNLNMQLQTRSMLGSAWRRNGETQKAEETLREVLEAQKELLGPEHDAPLHTQKKLGETLGQLGKFSEAEELIRDACNKSAKTLGRNHGHTLESELSLAKVLERQQKFGEAEDLARKVLRVAEEVCGWEYALTRAASTLLSNFYQRQGRLEEAYSLMEKAFRICLPLLGPNHRVTKFFEQNLFSLTQQKEQLQSSQDGASASTNPRHQIVSEGFGAVNFGLSSSG